LVKKIEVLGMELHNYPLRESMTLVETFLNNTVLNTIEEVSFAMLLSASEDERVKEAISGIDLTIPGETEILVQAGERNSSLINDIEEDRFFREFLKRVVRNYKNVFLLCNTPDEIDRLKTYITSIDDRVKIAGQAFMEEPYSELSIINEINSASPDVILSTLSSPLQELFIHEQKKRLYASVWYGMNDRFKKLQGTERFRYNFFKSLRRISFRRIMVKTEEKKEN